MANTRFLSFAGGEISPSLYARCDTVKYQTGLKTCLNFMVMRHGGVANRPGTQFIAATKTAAKTVRLIPFVFNSSQTYILEFGDLYMRVYKNGAQLQSGGSPYEIVTPYAMADLATLQYIQSADIVTIVHPNYAPRELARTADTTWTLTAITFTTALAAPTGLASSSAGTTYYYKVTAVNTSTSEETLPSAAAGSTSLTSTLTWNAVSGAQYYNVYRLINGQYGWIGIAGTNSFTDATYTPDPLDAPPVDRQPFTGTGNYPSTCAYYQQRLIFANTDNNPEGVWTSKSTLRKNFMISTPIQDDDAVTWQMSGSQVNEVNHLLDVGKLLAFTTSSEWAIEGNTAGILTPGEVNPRHHTSNGSGILRPLIVDGSALYVQARGSVIRDIGYDYQSDGYKGNELTIFAAHLFDRYTLVDWAYQQIPHSIVWAVRNDGVLLGLTYVREHQVFGWHRHEFNGAVTEDVQYLADGTYTADGSIYATGGTATDTVGLVENVCVVPEGTEDALYLCIKRTINGAVVRYIERMSTRQVNDIVDYVGMDSALTYDGRNTGATTMALSGGSDWGYTDNLTLTASTAYFSAGEVGNEMWLTGTYGDLIRCRITVYTSTTVVTVKPNKTVPLDMRGVNLTTWSRAVDEVTGLSHLEGEYVSVFVDGTVSASPNNSSYPLRQVISGTVMLDDPHAVIHVGLPITADIETLNIDTAQGPSMADKKKNVTKVTLFVESTRGVWAGMDEDRLNELKIRNTEGYDDPVALATGTVDMNISGQFNESGKILIRQTEPLPVAILAIVPSGFMSA